MPLGSFLAGLGVEALGLDAVAVRRGRRVPDGDPRHRVRTALARILSRCPQPSFVTGSRRPHHAPPQAAPSEHAIPARPRSTPRPPAPRTHGRRTRRRALPLGDAHCPIDEIETPALRLAAVLAGRPERFIAELGTAAWVWGATRGAAGEARTVRRPARAGAPARRHGTRACARSCCARSEVRELGGRRVTTPLRTAVDLATGARARSPTTMPACVRGLALRRRVRVSTTASRR